MAKKAARAAVDPHTLAIAQAKNDSDRNLIACCQPCNSSKQAKSLTEFAVGRGDDEIKKRVRRITRRRLPMAQAREILGLGK